MTSQSWTSWILDSYASSVHTSGEASNDILDDESFAAEKVAASPISTTLSHTLSHSRSNSASSPTSSPFPYGPYYKSGRGGAGNFTWQSDLSPDSDLEGQNIRQRQSSLSERQRAAALTEHLETKDAVQSKSLSRKKPEYLKVGIGGAANMALSQSNEVQSPRSASFSRTSFSSNGTISIPLSPGGHGRGGAGNFVAIAESKKAADSHKEQEERLKVEKTRQEVEAEVDGILQMPQGAVTSQGRSRDRNATTQ